MYSWKAVLLVAVATAATGVVPALGTTPPQPLDIDPSFCAKVGGAEIAQSVYGESPTGSPHYVAVGETIHFTDESSDKDLVPDGLATGNNDPINRRWWYVDGVQKKYTAQEADTGYDWLVENPGQFIVKEKVEDDPPSLTVNDTYLRFCSMRLEGRSVDYVTVTPDPACVAVGGTIQLTGHAWDDNGTPGNTSDDIELAATFDWTVDPALGTLAPASGKQSTLTAGANPGSCTVTATHDPSDESGTATVHVVAVEKIQYSGDGWQDVTSTLYVLNGTTVTFRAVKSASSPSWPSGKPVWSGTSGASGTGETKSVTFSTVSSNPSDVKTVTAECGNTVTIEAVVYELTGVTTPVDNFARRSETNYGIEEEVNLSFTTTPAGITAAQIGGLEWHLAEGGSQGSVTGGTDGTGLFDAEASGGSAHLKLDILSGPSQGAGPTVHRNIVEPWGAFTRRRPGTNVWHVQGVCSIGFHMLGHLLPNDVSYDSLEFREGSCWSTANGYLSIYHHIEHMTGTWRAVGSGEATNGSQIDGYDTVSLGNTDPSHAQGYFIWPIPWQYKVPGGSAVTWITMDHEAWTDETGWIEQRKGDVDETKNLNDPSQDYGEPE